MKLKKQKIKKYQIIQNLKKKLKKIMKLRKIKLRKFLLKQNLKI